MKYAYILVEGPHDVEFVGRFLKQVQCVRVQFKSELDSFWHSILPTTFPFNSERGQEDLLKRAPIPVFFQSEHYSIAVHSAEGIASIVQTLQETLFEIELETLAAIAFVLDADQQNPLAQYQKLYHELNRTLPNLQMPSHPGQIHSESGHNSGENSRNYPYTGAYVLPDNYHQGTLEKVLLNCGQQVYSDLHAKSSDFVKDVVQSLKNSTLISTEKREIKKPAGQEKAVMGVISSILKPGRAVQVAIQDNRWISSETLNIPELSQFRDFLSRLLDLPIPTGTE